MAGAFKFRAFISYSHKDRAWADWLHKALEGYRVPSRLIGTPGPDGPLPSTLFPIFRDRDELPSSSDLSAHISAALEQSANLIVICSPNSARSQWVREEIIAFKRLGRERRIFAVIADGEPNSDALTAPELECFPDALRFRLDADGRLSTDRTEPIAADCRPNGDGRENAKLKLVAGLLGVGFDTLRQRELEAARRRLRILQGIVAAMLLLTVGAVTAAYFAYSNAIEAKRERDQAFNAQLRLLTDSAAADLNGGDVRTAENVMVDVLAQPAPDATAAAAAASVFQEARAADYQFAALSGHHGPVESASYSPNGMLIVTSSDDGTARVWNAMVGIQVASLSGHRGSVRSASFSPDSRFIVTSSADSNATVWELRSGRRVGVLRGHSGTVNCAVYSPDGKRIVTAGDDMTARVWDAASFRQIAILRGHAGRVFQAAYSRDGMRIVTASDDKTARIWDTRTYATVRIISGHTEPVRAATFSPDGTRVATASQDKTARIWSVNTGKQVTLLYGNFDTVRSVCFSPDGRRIVTGSDDGSARIWDTATGGQLYLLSGHKNAITNASYAPSGRWIVTSSTDGTGRIWFASPPRLMRVLVGHIGLVNAARYSPNGSRIVTAGADDTAKVWDAQSGRQIGTLLGHNGAVDSAEFSSDGRLIVTASYDGTARLWNSGSFRSIGVLRGHHDLVTAATFSPDGRSVATASFDSTARIWDARTSSMLRSLIGHRSVVRSVAYSPDGKRIVTASDDGTARIWDAKTGRRLLILSGHSDGVRDASFSPDGRRVVTASNDRTARVWDAATGQTIRILAGHNYVLRSARFSPDGRYIITAAYDKSARVWDVANGDELAVLPVHGDGVRSASYSPSGNQAVAASLDSTATIWDARIPEGLDRQVTWLKAATFEPAGEAERIRLGLPVEHGHSWPTSISKCDQVAASIYDPDRRSQGVPDDEIDVKKAESACAIEAISGGPRIAYEFGRALRAAGDITGAKRQFEEALQQGYRAAAIDLGGLLLDGRPEFRDAERANMLYQEAYRDGVRIGAFELGQFFELTASREKSRAAADRDYITAWEWYAKGRDAGEEYSIARFAQRSESSAITAIARRESYNRSLLSAFKLYSTALKCASLDGWPSGAIHQWRLRRASLARILSYAGNMNDVINSFNLVEMK